MEEALRITRDASHPRGSVGGRRSVEGQSSSMQSGLLKGTFGFNCSSSISSPEEVEGGKISNMMQQLHLLSLIHNSRHFRAA